ncbi:MAG: quercetin 2,3-dioxygenase [Aphanothece sp. CMT-3BRIN-NPC111]|jgi:quercetin dioxygenase-like cupin family protein|nr:quercetin 2,3-dioxygenase [Aphanothece sp. CMT-3BRIN-NPC111]
MEILLQKPFVLEPEEGNKFSVLNQVFTTKATGKDTKGAWAFYEVTDKAGGGAPLHTHPWDEAFYVLEGEVEIQAGKETTVAKPGYFINVPGKTAHAFKILSPSAKFIVLISPAEATEFYEEMGRFVSSTPPDMEKFQAIADKHSVRIFL